MGEEWEGQPADQRLTPRSRAFGPFFLLVLVVLVLLVVSVVVPPAAAPTHPREATGGLLVIVFLRFAAYGDASLVAAGQSASAAIQRD